MACGQLYFEDRNSESDLEVFENALAVFGLALEEPIDLDDVFALWPDNLAIFNLWSSLQTQWHVGMSGATGLDYAGVAACMSMRGIRKKDQISAFEKVQMMEKVTLNEWEKKR